MKLTQIYIYPIKSLGAIALQKSYITERGLEYDRRWLLTDQNNRFITQRETPELVRFIPGIENNEWLIVEDKSTGQNIRFSMEFTTGSTEEVTVWDDSFPAKEVDKEVSQWFSEILGKPVKLMFQPEESHRKVDNRYAVRGNEIVSAADGFPILMISEESLSNLNAQMNFTAEMLRFRPNLVVSELGPHEEDELRTVEIGSAVLAGVKPCSRCLMVDRDPESGKPSGSVLKTLSGYRRVGNKVNFGQNFLVLKTGVVQAGESMRIV